MKFPGPRVAGPPAGTKGLEEARPDHPGEMVVGGLASDSREARHLARREWRAPLRQDVDSVRYHGAPFTFCHSWPIIAVRTTKGKG